MIKLPKGGGSFSEGVCHLKSQELVSVWGQRTGRKGGLRWYNTVVSTLSARLLTLRIKQISY